MIILEIPSEEKPTNTSNTDSHQVVSSLSLLDDISARQQERLDAPQLADLMNLSEGTFVSYNFIAVGII
jgi:cytoplasmic iron level regulating protein YaaA (DUF328/UPF0246 family)